MSEFYWTFYIVRNGMKWRLVVLNSFYESSLKLFRCGSLQKYSAHLQRIIKFPIKNKDILLQNSTFTFQVTKS